MSYTYYNIVRLGEVVYTKYTIKFVLNIDEIFNLIYATGGHPL